MPTLDLRAIPLPQRHPLVYLWVPNTRPVS
jgi:hypothetical protein